MYKVTQIDFDFSNAVDEVSLFEQQQIASDVMNLSWVVNDPDELVEEITSWTGWCINSLEYVEE